MTRRCRITLRILYNDRLIQVGKRKRLGKCLLQDGCPSRSDVPTKPLSRFRNGNANASPTPPTNRPAPSQGISNTDEPFRGLAEEARPRTKCLRLKVLADTIEAIIGAAFLEEGLSAAAGILERLGVDKLDEKNDHARGWSKKWKAAQARYPRAVCGVEYKRWTKRTVRVKRRT